MWGAGEKDWKRTVLPLGSKKKLSPEARRTNGSTSEAQTKGVPTESP